MGITTTQFIRKPLYVDAVRITGANFDEMVAWCQGEVQVDEVPGKGTTKKYIKVRVHNPKNARQTKAFVGDWLLYTEKGYKVYTNKAFRASFDEVQRRSGVSVAEATEQARVQAQAVAAEKASDGQIMAITETVAPGVTATSFEEVHVKDPAAQTPEASMALDKDYAVEQPENVETVPSTEPIEPVAAEGKRVLSIAEQKELTPTEVRELVQSGEAVLAQDIAAA